MTLIIRIALIDGTLIVTHRAMGHSLQHAMSSFRVTGDMRVLEQMAVYLRDYVAPTTDPYYGYNEASGFQTGYLSRWNLNLWQGQ